MDGMDKTALTTIDSAVVRFADVHTSYGQVPVLKGISFGVDRSEVVVRIGRSGSGKSTALRCVNGSILPATPPRCGCGRRVSAAAV